MNLNYMAGNQDFRAVIPFSKVERMADGRLMIEGIATSEAVDHDNEVIDYDSAKAAFSAWSGNIREQHDAKKAVGRALSVTADDAKKQITVRAFISNGAKDTQEKCLDGTLSCYSIGGSVEKREAAKVKKSDGTEIDVQRVYVKGLSETSVVDKGSNPDTSFSLVKTVGDHLEGVGLEAEVEEVKKEEEKKAESVTEETKETEKKAPVTTEPLEVKGNDEDVASFAKALQDADLTMKDAIEALGVLVKVRADKDKTPEPPTVEVMLTTFKALDDAGKKGFVSKLELPADEMREAMEYAMRAGVLQKQLDDPELSVIGLAKLAEEHLTEDERKPLKSLEDVKKAILGKAMTRAHMDKMQAIHDHSAAMGAACGAGKSVDSDLAKTVEELTKTVQELRDAPRPHVMLRTVSKEDSNSRDGAKPTDWVTRVPYEEMVKMADGITPDWVAMANNEVLRKKYGAAKAA